MKQGKYLKFHFDCLEAGEWVPEGGLCGSFGNDKRFKRFKPSEEDLEELILQGLPDIYWGCGVRFGGLLNRAYKYTPLRQTIVLFLAAINGEL